MGGRGEQRALRAPPRIAIGICRFVALAHAHLVLSMSSPPSPSGLSSSSEEESRDVYTTNPYANHPSLTPTESEVLWEYAKLARRMKEVRSWRYDH